MRRSRRPIVIASRRSRLAQSQAKAVGRALSKLHPNISIEFIWLDSEGDLRQDIPLTAEGGKGLFIKAVEKVLLSGKADLAVHSLKDLPVELTPGLSIAAIPRRADARDCFISPIANRLEDLPHGATVGTSSPRRAAQVKRIRPDLIIKPMRGNVDTRLNKVLEQKLVDATLLAVSGLKRSGFSEHANKPISKEQILPAGSQGALALQCRADDHVTLSRCLLLNDPATSACVHLERAVIAGLEGNCHSAIAVHAEPCDEKKQGYYIRAQVLSEDGQISLEHEITTTQKRLAKDTRKMIQKLREMGAYELLNAPAMQSPSTSPLSQAVVSTPASQA